MQTMDVYVVYRWESWESWENDQFIGIYRNKDDAYYIRDHCEALEIDSFVMRAPAGSRDEMSKEIEWLDRRVGFSVDEEEVYL